MKKSALLAVSALSLGVVGLATFTPVVSAVTSMTGDATVTVNVSSQLAIGGQPITGGQEDQDDHGAFEALSVDFETVAANQVASEQTKDLVVQNNSGKDGALTISATDANLTNVDGEHKIPSTDATPVAGTATWGVKSEMTGGTAGAWKAVSSSPVTLAQLLSSQGAPTQEPPTELISSQVFLYEKAFNVNPTAETLLWANR